MMNMWKYLLLLLPFSLYCSETVYCIHGFMRKPSSMHRMRKTLEENGYTVAYFGYPSREKTIQEHTDDLIKQLKQTAEEKPNEPIHFVTHSLGGIIIRCAHNHPECPLEAKQGRAVLLSPPNQGSAFGRFLGKVGAMRKLLGKKAGRQILFSPHFDYIGEFPEKKEVLVISGTCGFNPVLREKNDGKVSVSESCLSTPHHHITHFSGHSWMMYSTTIAEKAAEFLQTGRHS